MSYRIAAGLPRRALLAASIALAFGSAPAEASRSILFIGNSFTYGALASVQTWNPGSVTDLNGPALNGTNGPIGGVPALFEAFTAQAGLDYAVSLETFPGSNLDFHYNNRRALIEKPWDVVVMHGQSNLDFQAPNNPAKISQYTGLLGAMFMAQNPGVDIRLTATWSRADLTYVTASPWYGAPIQQMGIDVQKGYEVAAANNPGVVGGINRVGLAWNAAIDGGLADANPYDGIDPGKLNLWASDSYHASNAGYYLHALVVFGEVTGRDPRSLGAGETAAAALGITPDQAVALQGYAAGVLTPVPEPATWLMFAGGAAVLAFARRRRPAAA